jgi:hypothetical protein
MTVPDPRLRFRIYVDGALAVETWINSVDADADAAAANAAELHAAVTNAAAAAGSLWLTEVYDPAQPPANAYLRFGTDRDGMTEPEPEPRPIQNVPLPPWAAP